jgi:cellobiose epimerase
MKKIFIIILLLTFLNCNYMSSKSNAQEVLHQLQNEITNDLTENLLPFWIENSPDNSDPKKGFYGAINHEGEGIANAIKHNVLFTRYLWTYSAAYRVLQDPKSLELAHRAFQYLQENFIDNTYGGIYWKLNADGSVNDSNKSIYGQSFAIYAFSEYYRATQNELSLQYAIQIFILIELHGQDTLYGGYFETFNQQWEYQNFSEVSPSHVKSMNTHLHILEAYTNLYRIWPDEKLRKSMYELIDIIKIHMINTETYHQLMYFEQNWAVSDYTISFGHDIEFSWLFNEAAIVLGDAELIAYTEDKALKIARAQITSGLNSQGAMIYEKLPNETLVEKIEWWVQAEAIVGLLNAYSISKDKNFLLAARDIWDFTKTHVIDSKVGGWFPSLDKNGIPVPNRRKGDGWTCPYHNVRMGLEVYERFHEK